MGLYHVMAHRPGTIREGGEPLWLSLAAGTASALGQPLTASSENRQGLSSTLDLRWYPRHGQALRESGAVPARQINWRIGRSA